MGAVFAALTVLATAINLGIFAYGHILTYDRLPWEYPASTYIIAYLLFAASAAVPALMIAQAKVIRLLALAARAERGQPPAAPMADV